MRHMVSSCDLLTKAKWDLKIITQVSTVAIQPQKETLLRLAHRSCFAAFWVHFIIALGSSVAFHDVVVVMFVYLVVTVVTTVPLTFQ